MSTSTSTLPAPDVIFACLEGVLQALCDRPGETGDQRRVRQKASMGLIMGLMPRDVLQMMLAGQAALMNTLIADAGSDVLRGMVDRLKLKAQANVTAMSRVMLAQLENLMRLQHLPDKAARPVVTPAAAKHVEPVREKPVREELSREKPAAARTPPSTQSPVETVAMAAQEPACAVEGPVTEKAGAEKGAWLDNPCQERVLETPVDIAARTASVTRARQGQEIAACVDRAIATSYAAMHRRK